MQVFTAAIDNYLDPKTNWHLVGLSEDGGPLVSTLGVAVWDVIPAATFSFMLVAPDQLNNSFDLSSNGIMACADLCYEIAEEQDIFESCRFSLISVKLLILPIYENTK